MENQELQNQVEVESSKHVIDIEKKNILSYHDVLASIGVEMEQKGQ